jgi:hypothetical protein
MSTSTDVPISKDDTDRLILELDGRGYAHELLPNGHIFPYGHKSNSQKVGNNSIMFHDDINKAGFFLRCFDQKSNLLCWDPNSQRMHVMIVLPPIADLNGYSMPTAFWAAYSLSEFKNRIDELCHSPLAPDDHDGPSRKPVREMLERLADRYRNLSEPFPA